MSTRSYLVLVLLWFSLHACNARNFGVVDNDPAEEFQYTTSKKNDQKLNPGSVSIQPDRKYSVPDGPGEAKMEKRFEEKKINGEYNEPGKHFQAKGDHRIKGSADRKNWRVPRWKRGEQEPGFNLDYLPPKTHPPVHN